MQVTIKDRLIIQTILPPADSFINIALSRDIAEKVRLTQEIMDGVKMKGHAETGMTEWDDKLAENFIAEIEFSKGEIELLARVIKDMDTERKITPENYDTLKKIRDFVAPEKKS